jgi:serine/threonine-protein kinase RsbW
MMNISRSADFALADITIAADFLSVRHGLQHLFTQDPLISLSEECRDHSEIVLAEVLNNIVEHAYAGASGQIQISVSCNFGFLDICIKDFGRAMPDLKLPAGELHPLYDGQDPPEGGFGWHLIRSLTQDLQYQRVQDQNILQFRLALSLIHI